MTIFPFTIQTVLSSFHIYCYNNSTVYCSKIKHQTCYSCCMPIHLFLLSNISFYDLASPTSSPQTIKQYYRSSWVYRSFSLTANWSEIIHQVLLLNHQMSQEVAELHMKLFQSLYRSRMFIRHSQKLYIQTVPDMQSFWVQADSAASPLGSCEFSASVKGIFNSGGWERARESLFPTHIFPFGPEIQTFFFFKPPGYSHLVEQRGQLGLFKHTYSEVHVVYWERNW